MTAKHTPTKTQKLYLIDARDDANGIIFCGSDRRNQVAQRIADIGMMVRIDALRFKITQSGRDYLLKAEGRQP